MGSWLKMCSVVGRFSGTEQWLLKTSFHPANSWTSSGLFGFSEIIHFFAEKLRIATHCFGPMGDGINYTKFS